jgi:hypothetical protein
MKNQSQWLRAFTDDFNSRNSACVANPVPSPRPNRLADAGARGDIVAHVSILIAIAKEKGWTILPVLIQLDA